MKISLESHECFPEIAKLIESHAAEICWHGHKPDPNWEAYKTLMGQGIYYMFTARFNGELIGYAGFFLNKSLQFQTVTVATCDLIFLKPEFRGSGSRLIQFSSEALTSLGADHILHFVTNKKDYSRTLRTLGFEYIEAVWARKNCHT